MCVRVTTEGDCVCLWLSWIFGESGSAVQIWLLIELSRKRKWAKWNEQKIEMNDAVTSAQFLFTRSPPSSPPWVLRERVPTSAICRMTIIDVAFVVLILGSATVAFQSQTSFRSDGDIEWNMCLRERRKKIHFRFLHLNGIGFPAYKCGSFHTIASPHWRINKIERISSVRVFSCEWMDAP